MEKKFESRIKNVCSLMKKNQLDGLLICDPASIFYLSGIAVEPYERLFALYIDSSEKTLLFLNKLFNVSQENFTEIIFSDSDDYIKILSDNILKSGVLGVDGSFPSRFLLPLMSFNPSVKYINGSFCVDSVRGIKDSEEIQLMKQASAINDECMTAALKFIKPGITEKELASYIDGLFLKHHAIPSFETTVCFGKNAADPHHAPSDTVITKGDCVLIDMGCKKNGYCSDMTRTVFFQSAAPEVAKIHEIVRKANETAENIIKPGILLSDIDKAARSVIETAGFGEFFTHRTGHFIGQTVHEAGEVSSSSSIRAEKGMIFSIEPGIYIPNKYGVRIEDLILVTEDGYEKLNSVDKRWHIAGIS